MRGIFPPGEPPSCGTVVIFIVVVTLLSLGGFLILIDAVIWFLGLFI